MSIAIPRRPIKALIRFSASRRLFEIHAGPVYCLCALAVMVIVAATSFGTFDYDRAFFARLASSSGIVLLFAYAARWTGFWQIADPIEQLLLLYLTGLLFAFVSVILASSAAPMADPILRRADSLLFGMDRDRLLVDLALSRGAIQFWAWVYNCLAFSPIVALALLTWTGRRQRAWALLTALLATALVEILFVLVLPAYGTPPFPYEFIHVFDGVRDGSLRTLGPAVITGIITFPSMHAAHAIILACAYGWLGRWAIPMVILNLLMIAAALIVGGHYMVDLVAGVAVGLVVLHGSLKLHRRLPKLDGDHGEVSPRARQDMPGPVRRMIRKQSCEA